MRDVSIAVSGTTVLPKDTTNTLTVRLMTTIGGSFKRIIKKCDTLRRETTIRR